MKETCPSEMDTWVRVQKLVIVSDGMGGSVAPGYQAGKDQTALDPKWVEYFGFWAKVEWGTGSKQIDAMRWQSGVVCKMEANFDPRLAAKGQRLILPDGKIITLQSVTNRNQRSIYMDIKSEVGVGT